MRSLASIKGDMEFNKGLSLLIETLKSIAISQYYTMEKKIKIFKDFLPTVESFFEYIDIEKINHPFINPSGRAQAIITVTTDAGFMGGLNMKVVNIALGEAQKMPTTIVLIGERGKMYVRGAGISTVNFPGIQDDARYAQAMQLRDYIYGKAISGAFGTVKMVYPRCVSFGVQRIEVMTFMPFKPLTVKKARPGAILDMIVESLPKDMLEYLVYLWMGEMIYEILGLSRLAEFSARYVHLEESGDKLKEEDKKVKLQYFRVRHELVDGAMRELFAGRFVRGRK